MAAADSRQHRQDPGHHPRWIPPGELGGQQVAQPGLTPVVSPRLLAAERQSVRAIRLLTLGRPDAARRTYQLLESRLAELDTEPDPATRRLLRQAMKRPPGK
jgi:hypothetical protein